MPFTGARRGVFSTRGRSVDPLNLPHFDWPPRVTGSGRRIITGLNDRDDATTLHLSELSAAKNIFFTNNSISRRYGYVRYTLNPVTVTNGAPTKFFYFSPEGGTARWFVFANKDAFYLAGDPGSGTSTSTSAALNANVTDCIQYNAILYAVTGNTSDTLQQYNGTAWSAVTPDAAADNELGLTNGAKNCKYIVSVYDRLYLAGSSTNPQWVFISELTDPTYYKTSNVIKVDTKDGDAITGLVDYYGWVMIFKNDSIHAIPPREPTDTVFKRYIINERYGTKNINTAKLYGSALFFQASDGHIYILFATRVVKEFMVVKRLSGKLSSTIAGLAAADLANAWAVIDDFKYKLMVGNKCIVLDLLSSDLRFEEKCVWSIWQFDEANQTVGEINVSNKLLYTADATGRINRFPTGTTQHTDAGTAIDWYAYTPWFDLGRTELYKLFDRHFDYIKTTTETQNITLRIAIDQNTAILTKNIATKANGFTLGVDLLGGTTTLGRNNELVQSTTSPPGRGRRIQVQYLRNNDTADSVNIYGFTQYYEPLAPI